MGPCSASQWGATYRECVGHLSLPIHGLEEQQEALYPRGGESEDGRVVIQCDGQHRVCGLWEGRIFNKEEGGKG